MQGPYRRECKETEGLKICGCPYIRVHLLALLALLALTSCAYSRAFLCWILNHHLGIIITFFPPKPHSLWDFSS